MELGSGPGFLTEKILATFPHLKVTAIEIDPFLVAYAKDYLSPKKQISHKHVHQCEILQSSLIPTGLAANSFDSSKVLAKITVEWRKMLKSANHSILRQLYLASGEKPLEK